MPASTGRAGSRYSVPPINDAVRKPFCPTSVLVSTTGNATASSRPNGRPTIARIDGEIGHEAYRSPADEGHRIGKMRQQARDEQEGRRIMPGEVALITLAEHRDLHLLLNIPVIGPGRMAIEHQFAGGPDVDEIGRDAQALYRRISTNGRRTPSEKMMR